LPAGRATGILLGGGCTPCRLAEVFRWADEGLIDPQVSHACPLDACREAMLARWRGEVVGGCVRNP
jgi:NADPH2:quinone reductase